MATKLRTKPYQLRRHAGPIGLMFASTTSMIGSGWLFGAFHAAKLAGPWSIFSWILGAILITLLALCFAELAVIFPRSGALVHMSHASHGAGLGRIWGWVLFIAYVPIPAVEAEAVVTYANNYLPYFIQPESGGLLTAAGFLAAVVVLLVVALLNLLAIRWLLSVNTAITWWKIFVPVATVVALLSAALHPANLSAAPQSYSLTGIFTALPTAGVVFSFLGFRTAIDLAGESSDPNRAMPFALIGSIVLATVIYVALQVAFILVLAPGDIAHGWNQLDFSGSTGPFAGLAVALGMSWLAVLVYIDAYVSPAGTGLLMLTGGSRVLMANGDMRAGPRWLGRLSRAGVPWVSVLIMWAVGCLFLLPFPAWQKMVGYISAITVLTYGIGPVTLFCLRRNVPDLTRPFRLPAAWLIAPAAFIASNWIVFWTGFSTNLFMFSLLGGAFIVYAVYYHLIAKMPAVEFGWRHIAWLLPWFGGEWVLSWLGGLGGGLGLLSLGWEAVLIALWSLVVLAIAVRSALTSEAMREVIETILQDG